MRITSSMICQRGNAVQCEGITCNLYLNGTLTASVEYDTRHPHDDVSVYTSDGWYTPSQVLSRTTFFLRCDAFADAVFDLAMPDKWIPISIGEN